MENRNGDVTSPQISVMGSITFADSENFKKDTPFCIKNDGDAAVVLEVNLWGMPEGEFIATRFETGWCLSLKKVDSLNLKQWVVTFFKGKSI